MSDATALDQHAGPLRVLIVDDAPDLRTLVSFVLASSPAFDVAGEAADGREAIVKARELMPDLVLLDLSMPGMDGLEALPFLIEMGLKVVVLSGYTRDAMAAMGVENGALGYIEKGGSPADVLSQLAEVLGLSNSPAIVTPPVVLTDGFAAAALDGLHRHLAAATSRIAQHLPPGDDAQAALAALRATVNAIADTVTLPTVGAVVASPESLDLPTLVGEAIDLAVGADDGERLRITSIGRSVACHGPRAAVVKILWTLIENALRHSERAMVEVTISDRRVEVHDLGPGLNLDDPRHAFVPFVTGGGPGVGMGLAVAANLARAHGLRLWFEPRARGATFIVEVGVSS